LPIHLCAELLQLSVGSVMAQEPIEGVRSIPRERWDLLCSICRQRCGAKIQCLSCFTAYHPLCARVAGGRVGVAAQSRGVVMVVCLAEGAHYILQQPASSMWLWLVMRKGFLRRLVYGGTRRP
jgi:hypothetical protein